MTIQNENLATEIKLRTRSRVLEVAFGSADLDWREFTTFDPSPAKPRGVLIGDASRARRELGWTPKISFEEMIRAMVRADLARPTA